jgi:glycosyltransferase involved in cell wall biosynthesis
VEKSPASRRDLALAEDEYYLIAVGRLVERKGFEYLIKAMAALPVNVELLIIGDGPLEDDLKLLARTTGVEERVCFLGYQDQERLWSYLLVANCYVLSSLHEGLGIVVQEAMYAGLPIVATNNGGQVDLIQEGRNGLLVGTADVDALIAAISRLYGDRELASTMARNNQEDLKRMYMPVNCKEYIDLFYEVLAADASGATAVKT